MTTATMTAADAIKALFFNTRLGVELDEGLTVRFITTGGKGSVEINSGSQSIQIPPGVLDDLIAALEAAKGV